MDLRTYNLEVPKDKFCRRVSHDMPLVTVAMYPGRTKQQKEELAMAITEAAVKILNTERRHVIVTFDERPKENWYQAGEPL